MCARGGAINYIMKRREISCAKVEVVCSLTSSSPLPVVNINGGAY